jgi:hypothetical protein
MDEEEEDGIAGDSVLEGLPVIREREVEGEICSLAVLEEEAESFSN